MTTRYFKNKLKRLYLNYRSNFISLFLPHNYFFAYKGYCPICNKRVLFSSLDNWLRDNFVCNNCFSIPRQRALMLIIEKYFPNWTSVKIHESSPGNCSISEKLKNCNQYYIASQYYSNMPLGADINGFKNEDLENQTFEDESFDIVITQDVMEHIFDPKSAFKEIARTLKKGGAHIFTVPLVNKHKKSEVWAERGDFGNIVFLKNPEYHLNPIDPKGSLVTMHWGFDIVNYIKDTSGLDTVIEYIDNLDYGIRAEYIEVLVSFKN